MHCVLAGVLLPAILGFASKPVVRLLAAENETDRRIVRIQQTGADGRGAAEARQAARELAGGNVDLLPRLLLAMDTPNIVAANYFRTAYEKILKDELARPRPRIPVEFLRSYVQDTKRQSRARRLAMETLTRVEPGFEKSFVAGALEDPEFREEAVSAALARGESARVRGNKPEAIAEFQRAYRHARSNTQVVEAAAKLKSLGQAASVIEQLGFLVDWHLLGPFSAPGMTGFATVFPPENKVDLQASHDGLEGKIRWKKFRTTDQLGQVNLIEAVAPVKEAVAYAYAEFDVAQPATVELRCSADDNLTVWLNGEKILSRLQWLNGTRLDRFSAPAKLRGGRNRVLVKICQGPQHKDPSVPNNWTFQLRFCHGDGLGVRLKPVTP